MLKASSNSLFRLQTPAHSCSELQEKENITLFLQNQMLIILIIYYLFLTHSFLKETDLLLFPSLLF